MLRKSTGNEVTSSVFQFVKSQELETPTGGIFGHCPPGLRSCTAFSNWHSITLSINVLALSCRAGQNIGAKTLILLVNRKLSFTEDFYLKRITWFPTTPPTIILSIRNKYKHVDMNAVKKKMSKRAFKKLWKWEMEIQTWFNPIWCGIAKSRTLSL